MKIVIIITLSLLALDATAQTERTGLTIGLQSGFHLDDVLTHFCAPTVTTLCSPIRSRTTALAAIDFTT